MPPPGLWHQAPPTPGISPHLSVERRPRNVERAAFMTSRERFHAALACTPLERPPLWIMRQAGRYLPEYRALKAKSSFLAMVRTPAVAADNPILGLFRQEVDEQSTRISQLLLRLEQEPERLDLIAPVQHRLQHALLIDEAFCLQVIQRLDQASGLVLKRRELALQLSAGILARAQQAQRAAFEG